MKTATITSLVTKQITNPESEYLVFDGEPIYSDTQKGDEIISIMVVNTAFGKDLIIEYLDDTDKDVHQTTLTHLNDKDREQIYNALVDGKWYIEIC